MLAIPKVARTPMTLIIGGVISAIEMLERYVNPEKNEFYQKELVITVYCQ